LAEIYGPISITTPINHEPDQAQQDQEQEQEFEFRLFFSTPTIKEGNGTQTKAQKIVLRESEEETGEGAFILPRRDRKFYISEKAQGPELLRYQASAVSGEDILKARKKRAWGLEVPWRVTVLLQTSPNSKSKPTQISNLTPASNSNVRKGEEAAEKKTKPNKKRRIILRERKKKKDSAEESRRKEREEREEKGREKKTRRNREKKVKRKLKEKAKKTETPGGVEGVVENGNGGETGDDETKD
jgi:hypothetical protein